MSDPLHRQNGFEFALFPAKTDKASSLVIYLHGMGGNAEDFKELADMFHDTLPRADIIALQAPVRIYHPDIPPEVRSYTWFPYNGYGGSIAGVVLSHLFNRLSVAGKVENFARAQLKQLGLTEKN